MVIWDYGDKLRSEDPIWPLRGKQNRTRKVVIWSGSVNPNNTDNAFDFNGNNGDVDNDNRNNNNSVRCVGR